MASNNRRLSILSLPVIVSPTKDPSQEKEMGLPEEGTHIKAGGVIFISIIRVGIQPYFSSDDNSFLIFGGMRIPLSIGNSTVLGCFSGCNSLLPVPVKSHTETYSATVSVIAP